MASCGAHLGKLALAETYACSVAVDRRFRFHTAILSITALLRAVCHPQTRLVASGWWGLAALENLALVLASVGNTRLNSSCIRNAQLAAVSALEPRDQTNRRLTIVQDRTIWFPRLNTSSRIIGLK